MITPELRDRSREFTAFVGATPSQKPGIAAGTNGDNPVKTMLVTKVMPMVTENEPVYGIDYHLLNGVRVDQPLPPTLSPEKNRIYPKVIKKYSSEDEAAIQQYQRELIDGSGLLDAMRSNDLLYKITPSIAKYHATARKMRVLDEARHLGLIQDEHYDILSTRINRPTLQDGDIPLYTHLLTVNYDLLASPLKIGRLSLGKKSELLPTEDQNSDTMRIAYYFVPDKKGSMIAGKLYTLLVVAGGLTSLKHPKEDTKLVANSISQMRPQTQSELLDAVGIAHKKLMAQGADESIPTGSMLSTALLENTIGPGGFFTGKTKISSLSIGNGRIYRFGQGQFDLMSQDHGSTHPRYLGQYGLTIGNSEKTTFILPQVELGPDNMLVLVSHGATKLNNPTKSVNDPLQSQLEMVIDTNPSSLEMKQIPHFSRKDQPEIQLEQVLKSDLPQQLKAEMIVMLSQMVSLSSEDASCILITTPSADMRLSKKQIEELSI